MGRLPQPAAQGEGAGQQESQMYAAMPRVAWTTQVPSLHLQSPHPALPTGPLPVPTPTPHFPVQCDLWDLK